MKIDVFAHFCPKEYIDAFSKRVGQGGRLAENFRPALWDVGKRLELMDRYEDYVEVLVPHSGVETFCSPEDAAYLTAISNDAVAELLVKYPDKFVGAVASLPLNNIDAALKEINRAIDELGFQGILLNTPIFPYGTKKPDELGYDYESMKPIDLPEFMPIYESMSGHKLPIWIHPVGWGGVPVYPGEKRNKYMLALVLGWPVESAVAMSRLVCSGILARYPDLKFIIHHCGSGLVPALASRMDQQFTDFRLRGIKFGQPGQEDLFKVKPAIDYFRMFYADTVLYGGTAGLMCGYDFFGAEHMLFGTDVPFGMESGDIFIRMTIEAVNSMNISDADKEMIFEGNAKRILGLDTRGGEKGAA